jgi:hypothetical protein
VEKAIIAFADYSGKTFGGGRMTEEKKDFDQVMSESKSELEALRAELNDLMVRFGLRSLRLYQTGKNEPLKRSEISSLVKYELDNAVADLAVPSNIEAIIKKTAAEWEKQQK